MAIYQFDLHLIPKSVLTIDKQTITEKQEDCALPSVESYWQASAIKADPIIAEVDHLLPRADWGNDEMLCNWKQYSDSVDHNACLILNSKGNIQELMFRADLREDGLVFLKAMIQLAARHDWLLCDFRGNLAEAEFTAVAKLIV